MGIYNDHTIMTDLGEKFLPVATDEDAVTGIPVYHPSGPGSASYAISVVDGSDDIQYSSAGSGAGTYFNAGSSTTGFNVSSNGDGIDGGTGDSSGRSSHLFLKCCCDCRRAVLIVNGIAISMKILSMIIIGILGSFVTKNLDSIEAGMEDDEFRKELDEMMKEGMVPVLEAFVDILAIAGIGLAMCGIYGALKFKKWGIITAGSTYALGLLLGVLTLDFFTVTLSALLLYPHVIMYKEMKEGIMTELNYHKVARCCGDRNM